MLRLFANSSRATAHGPLTWRTWTGILTVALLVTGLLAWAFWSPTSNHATAKAAVVNNDQPVTVDGQTVPLGRQLAADLLHSDSSAYQWVITDAGDAASGLAEGSYSAVVTIPAGFSRQATSAATATPLAATAGTLSIQTSGNAGVLDPMVSRDVAQATVDTLNTQVVQTYLDNIYVGFTTIHGQVSKAADGASQLATGADRVASGAGAVATGADQLVSGTSQLASGTAQLSTGLTQLQQQTSSLPTQTRALANGAQQVARGDQQLADTVTPIANQIITVLDTAPSAETAAQKFQQFAAQCAANGGTPRFCDQLSQAANQFSGDAATIDTTKNTVRAKTVQTRDDVQALATGANQVAGGAAQLAAAAPKLTNGIATAAAGAEQVDSGAQRANTGAHQLATGAHDLGTGANQLDTGTHTLADSLAKGRDQIPSYDAAQRDHLKQVAATPLAATATGPSGFGPSIAAFILVLALWATALATYLVIRAVPPHVLTSRHPTWRIIITAAAPGATIAALAGTVLSIALAPWLHLDIARWFAFLAVTLLTAGAFIAVNQALVAILKRPGRFAAIAVLLLTLAAGVISSVPGPFTTVLPYLPTHGAIIALRAIVTGGSGAASGVAELVVWLAIGTIATVVITDRRRVVPSRDLRPSRSSAHLLPSV